jgi:hypothetical protein
MSKLPNFNALPIWQPQVDSATKSLQQSAGLKPYLGDKFKASTVSALRPYPIHLNSGLDTKLAFQQFLNRWLGDTKGRPHAMTLKFVHSIGKAQQTIRKNYCLVGDAFGVVPIKVWNRLLWPIERIAQLLTAGDAK